MYKTPDGRGLRVAGLKAEKKRKLNNPEEEPENVDAVL